MRISYDGGSPKSHIYFVEIIANPDKRRTTAEIELRLFWDDGKRNHDISREFEISRQRSADTLYSELLGMFERAGFYPAMHEQDELHAFITQAVRYAVKTA